MSEITPVDRRGNEPPFRIETLATPEGTEISYSPERGGIITSMKLKKSNEETPIEILYMDEDTFNEPGKNVKGGIPDLFPNAGPLRNGNYPNLKQHGFARNSGAWIQEPTGDPRTFSELLKSDDASKEAFPHDWEHRMGGRLEEDGSLTLTQGVENKGEKPMPLSMGLHPYFRVDPGKKKDIKFDFPGGDEIERQYEAWANDGTVKIDNPKYKDPDAVMRVIIPDVGTVVLDVSAEYRRIWIWSLPDKEFVCVEPVMRDAGGLEDDPQMVAPGAAYEGRVNVRLE